MLLLLREVLAGALMDAQHVVIMADTLLRLIVVEGVKALPWFVAGLALVLLHVRWTRRT